MPNPFFFQIPTQIIYGKDSANLTGDIAQKLGLKKALIITDKGVSQSGVLERISASLAEARVECVLFDEIEPNPTIKTVDRAAEHFSIEECSGVVAVGGGSPLDAGKAVAVLAANPGSAFDYLGVDKVKNTSAPVIAIPTTAGTAAEITDVAVLSDPEKKLKAGLRAPSVAPRYAILDPVLTLGLPPIPTRDSGLDALTHAIEAYISVNSWAASDAVALKAIEMIGKYLRRAVHNGRDLEARDGMLAASLMAGMAFHNTKLCLVHAITGPLGGVYNLPHGAINAIVLPHAMEFLLPGAVEKYADIADALGENISDISKRAAAEKAVEAVYKLSADVQLPPNLSIFGVVKDEELPGLAATISSSFMVPLSPRVASSQDILTILQRAF
jgi:alcohol dehydrogenase